MYKQALSKNGQLVPALQGLANVTRYRGKYEESEQAFMKAIKIQPNNAFLYVDLGKLYRNWDKFSEAEAAFKKALRLDPKNDTLYSYGLGYLYRDEGKFDLAVQSFEKAVSLNPKNDFNYMGLGDIYRDIGEYEKSEVNFKKAISMNPKSESYLGLGYLYLKQNKLPEAEQAFKDYLLLIKPKAEVYSGLGHIYVQQQKYDDAEQMFRKSIELNPTLGGWEALADLFSRQGRASDAVRAREEGQKARQVEGMKQ
jgi:tetratricopeptide (TPR) repeat protein